MIESSPILILVIEDDPVLQKHIVKVAAHYGWKVVVSPTAADGFVQYSQPGFLPNLILMDLSTPGAIDGLECSRQIREAEKETDRRVPIIAFTAHAYHDDRTRCLEAGMDDYLSKPFTMSELAEVVNRWIPERDENGAG